MPVCTTASKWRRASEILFRQRRGVHRSRASDSRCVANSVCLNHSSFGRGQRSFVNGSRGSGFHGNPSLLNCGSKETRITRPVRISAFLFDSASSRSQPVSQLLNLADYIHMHIYVCVVIMASLEHCE